MTPKDGGNRSVVFADYDPTSGYSLSVGQLFPALKSMVPAFAKSFVDGLVPLPAAGYSSGHVSYVGDQLVMGFSHPMDTVPTSPVYMNYAVGRSVVFGLHEDRGCFSFDTVGMCVPAMSSVTGDGGKDCKACKKCPKCPSKTPQGKGGMGRL